MQMKSGAISINPEALGAYFANLDSGDQANFFRGLVAELKLCESQHHVSMQFSYVASDLTDNERGYLENQVFCMLQKSEI